MSKALSSDVAPEKINEHLTIEERMKLLNITQQGWDRPDDVLPGEECYNPFHTEFRTQGYSQLPDEEQMKIIILDFLISEGFDKIAKQFQKESKVNRGWTGVAEILCFVSIHQYLAFYFDEDTISMRLSVRKSLLAGDIWPAMVEIIDWDFTVGGGDKAAPTYILHFIFIWLVQVLDLDFTVFFLLQVRKTPIQWSNVFE